MQCLPGILGVVFLGKALRFGDCTVQSCFISLFGYFEGKVLRIARRRYLNLIRSVFGEYLGFGTVPALHRCIKVDGAVGVHDGNGATPLCGIFRIPYLYFADIAEIGSDIATLLLGHNLVRLSIVGGNQAIRGKQEVARDIGVFAALVLDNQRVRTRLRASRNLQAPCCCRACLLFGELNLIPACNAVISIEISGKVHFNGHHGILGIK